MINCLFFVPTIVIICPVVVKSPFFILQIMGWFCSNSFIIEAFDNGISVPIIPYLLVPSVKRLQLVPPV